VQPTFALRPSANIAVVQKLQTDGLALTQARWSLVGSDAGERVEMSGRGAIVSRRQPDGSWRILLDNPLSPEEDR
jgi:ketosteroid isomerase-like protein